MFDTHAHLDDERFDKDRDGVIRRAAEAGAEGILCVHCVSSEAGAPDKFARILEGADIICGAAGIHPHDAKDAGALWKTLEAALLLPKIAALGEIGLDYHYDNSPRAAQKEIFRAQLRLAAEKKLPVIIHSREAMDDTLAVLKEEKYSGGGVMHCYSGTAGEAKIFLDMGFYISIAGPVTFPNAAKLKEAAAAAPIGRLLIETDSPYLAPQAKRGMRNEPAYVKYVAEEIAALRKTSVQEIERITTENARRLFGAGTAAHSS